MLSELAAGCGTRWWPQRLHQHSLVMYGEHCMGECERSFLGVPVCDLAKPLPAADVIIVGAGDATPYDPGCASHAVNAPKAIRNVLNRYQHDLLRWDFDQGAPLLDLQEVAVFDAGDIDTDPATPEHNRDAITTNVRKIIANGSIPIVLGGDDSVPIPVFAAYREQAGITIIQIDAHLDWRDERNGLRHTFSSTMRRASEMPWVKKIIQVGLRGIGGSREPEYRAALEWGSCIYTAHSVRQDGIAPVIARVEPGANCLITIDCDGLDPSVIPAVIIPQHAGLGYDHVISLIRGVASKAHIVGVNLVELVPERDVNDLGSLAAARIICNAIGEIGRQRKNPSRTPISIT